MMEPMDRLRTKEKLPSFVSLRLSKECFMKALFLWSLEPLLVEYMLVGTVAITATILLLIIVTQVERAKYAPL